MRTIFIAALLLASAVNFACAQARTEDVRVRPPESWPKREAYGLDLAERERVEKLLRKVEFADKRKTTLYRALEILLSVQEDYLVSGEPGRRRPLSQKTLAKNLEVDPSVLNRMVSNKSIQMPWGMEAPMSVLLPSSKQVNLERLYAIAAEKPELSDEKLRTELKARHGIALSRRSVAQYRKDLSVNCSGKR